MTQFETAEPIPYGERHIPYEDRQGARVWPDDARIAVLFYIAAEEWEWYKAEHAPPKGNRREEGVPSLSARTAVKYGFDVGLPRIDSILNEHDISSTIFATANAALQHPERMRDLSENHEIAGHSFSEGNTVTQMTRDELREDIHASVESLEEVTGQKPVGWLGPGAIANLDTIELLAEEGFLYNADLQDDELPYFIDIEENTLVQATYRMVGNTNDYHLPFSSKGARLPPEEVLDYLKSTFDIYYETAGDTPLVFYYGIHPYVTGRPDGAYVLDEYIKYLRSFDQTWFCNYQELCEWWMDEYDDGYDLSG